MRLAYAVVFFRILLYAGVYRCILEYRVEWVANVTRVFWGETIDINPTTLYPINQLK